MANMKFYFTPGSCSIGIHILLEELELVFEAYPVNLVKGENLTPEYLAINPQGTVPSLVLGDGVVLSDFISIALRLAQRYPQGLLLPESPVEKQWVLDTLDYCVNKIHGQGYTRVFTAGRYANGAAREQAVIAQGWDIVRRGLTEIENRLATGKLSQGAFTLADAALFYIEFWAQRSQVALPPLCHRHYRRMLTRPAVRQVLMEEGYRSELS